MWKPKHVLHLLWLLNDYTHKYFQEHTVFFEAK